MAVDELRAQTASLLLRRLDSVADEAASTFPFTGVDSPDSEYCRRLGQMLGLLLATVIRDGGVDPRGGLIANLRTIVLERSLTMEQLFAFTYVIERTSLDELALGDELAPTTEAWPTVTQLIRHASFDLLAAFVNRALVEPSEASLVDQLTTLYTRRLFETVLIKEVERAGRSGFPFALILFDVDRLAAINEAHGYGVGDRILERIGFLVRSYFRQHDWVARHSDDSIAVLLIRTEADRAADLAERVRITVEERMVFADHRTNKPVSVTVSAGVVVIPGVAGSVMDPEKLLIDAEAAVARAKQAGRNRVETVTESAANRTLPHNSPSV